MKVCLICAEFLGWGRAGGFGFATRAIGRGLAARGVQVTAVVPFPPGRDEAEQEVDGIRVLGYPPRDHGRAAALFRGCDADVYHSQQESLATHVAQRAMPGRAHVVTCRDPRDWSDWWIEFKHPSRSRARLLATMAYYENPVTRAALRRADAVFVPAMFLRQKVRRRFGLAKEPGFLPTPIAVPETVQKATEPTVCFIGRLDRRKRPGRFLDLAARFPHVRFLAVGMAQDPRFQANLETTYGNIPNLEFTGFIDQFADPRHGQILARSWVLVNPAAREGLPNVFIEAAAHRCALVSSLDPDGFVSRFGDLAADEDYGAALARLLKGDAWRRLGEEGHRYVARTNAPDIAIQRHMDVYGEVMKGG
ncbi:MAG: glycosyltransferase family 4 protein [Hyphomicrobiales bacterium]|nr:glycosyltransferase family 4 protein [Hyphomicrobiales bacterium]MCP5374254.1 glycosyltransferase family 4 protein [Hyphomicrobiales bacterium]